MNLYSEFVSFVVKPLGLQFFSSYHFLQRRFKTSNPNPQPLDVDLDLQVSDSHILSHCSQHFFNHLGTVFPGYQISTKNLA